MAWQSPQVFGGTATTTTAVFAVTPPRRQFLIEHLGAGANLIVTWNDGGTWQIKPGASTSMYLKGTIVNFTVAAATGSEPWQAFAQD